MHNGAAIAVHSRLAYPSSSSHSSSGDAGLPKPNASTL